MLKTLSRRLTLLVITVLFSICIVFASIAYWWLASQLDRENREHLRTLNQALSASIEAPEREAAEHNGQLTIPDVLEEHDKSALQQQNIGIQWFDVNGRELASRGELKLNMPLSKTTFETQDTPHAMLLTRAVSREGKIVGYLRTSLSLQSTDTTLQDLRVGLAVGLCGSLAVAAAATWLIVRQALKPAQKGFDKLSQFTADASHELKTPITAIKMNSEVLTNYSKLSDQDLELVNSIAHAAEQMNKTVQDLLLLAQIDAQPDLQQQVAGEKKVSNLTAIVGEVINEHQFFAAEKNIKITTQMDSSQSKSVAKIPPHELKTVIANLLKNAIQHSMQDGQIIITEATSAQLATLTIKDFGVGIDRAHHERMFDRFWRADSARENSGGSGLGLSIAQSIVGRYGGTIDVQSSLGAGATFTVSFPSS